MKMESCIWYRKKFSYSVLAVFVLVFINQSIGQSLRQPTTILIGLNGYRWDCVYDQSLTNLQRLVKDGVVARKGMQSSFTTEKLPNLISIVTGLHPESHGFVGNHMYDPLLDEFFSVSTTDTKWFGDFVPIWISNEHYQKRSRNKNGSLEHKSAVIQWFGSNVQYHGRYPWYYDKTLKWDISPREQFNKILSFLDKKNPPNFILCYFDESDSLRHRYGPGSMELNRRRKAFDKELGIFITSLENKGVYNQLNIIVVSDHGFTKVLNKATIALYDVLDPQWYKSATLGATTSIWPKPHFENKIYENLKRLRNIQVYRKEDLPKRLHVKNHRRTPPIIAIADKGWVILKTAFLKTPLLGMHGYDNNVTDMNALFIARGPSFKSKFQVDALKNVDVYPLLCYVLGITPRPNNGSTEVIRKMLAEPYEVNSEKANFTSVLLAMIYICLVLGSFAACLFIYREKSVKQGYIRTRVVDVPANTTNEQRPGVVENGLYMMYGHMYGL